MASHESEAAGGALAAGNIGAANRAASPRAAAPQVAGKRIAGQRIAAIQNPKSKIQNRLRGIAFLCALGLMPVLSGCRAARITPTVRITMAGAQTPVELVSSWLNTGDATRFSITPISPVYLSQNGFDALKRGEADVACTDRVISAQELAEFGPSKPEGYRVGFYGYGLYVNLENRVDSIFAGHLKLLFQKRVTNWKQLGGADSAIRLIGPPKSTRGGDIMARQARIWFGDPTWDVIERTDEIIQAVADDPSALGFAPVGHDDGVRYLGLKMERHGSAAMPSLEEIESGDYGLAKIIYVYVNTPANGGAQRVLDYLLSEAGRRAIESTEVWAIARERVEVKSKGK